jgi:transcriptional regulator with XRE-family HTH domain
MAKAGKPRSAPDDDKYIGERVRQARIEEGWSQMQLGEALGVSFQQIQKYEKGVNRISLIRAEKIAELLHKPINWLLGLDKQGTQNAIAPAMSKFLTHKHGIYIAGTFFDLSPQQQFAVVNLIETFVGEGS